MSRPREIDFRGINQAALQQVELLLNCWLPGGRVEGAEYVALNPKRADRRLGSFKVNMRTGAWGDFATDAVGGDLISLAAYLGDLTQRQAANRLAKMLGVNRNDQ